ncbi:hypothetical protein J31TS3_59080 [Paenibacillus lactis]|uniref:Uncharacterized protein n=1 Tax=Paenibacillus lactis 154 TaxID=743719 RepID=G4HAZ0_9BACL|nr:hypothetical protein PaelaDRAFT_1323 [Paenibacillus lactis 154]GIO94681.1 hypothetical protein J31TS3_59080 [Paenibacillus lactis]
MLRFAVLRFEATRSVVRPFPDWNSKQKKRTSKGSAILKPSLGVWDLALTFGRASKPKASARQATLNEVAIFGAEAWRYPLCCSSVSGME